MAIYSYVEYTADGTTKNFSFTFDILQPEDIAVKKNDVELIINIDYSVNELTGFVTLSSKPSNGDVILIYRRVTISDGDFINFREGAILTASDLNKSTDQEMLSVQELYDRQGVVRDISDSAPKDYNNLSDIPNKLLARGNLGTGTIAVQDRNSVDLENVKIVSSHIESDTTTSVQSSLLTRQDSETMTVGIYTGSDIDDLSISNTNITTSDTSSCLMKNWTKTDATISDSSLSNVTISSATMSDIIADSLTGSSNTITGGTIDGGILSGHEISSSTITNGVTGRATLDLRASSNLSEFNTDLKKSTARTNIGLKDLSLWTSLDLKAFIDANVVYPAEELYFAYHPYTHTIISNDFPEARLSYNETTHAITLKLAGSYQMTSQGKAVSITYTGGGDPPEAAYVTASGSLNIQPIEGETVVVDSDVDNNTYSAPIELDGFALSGTYVKSTSGDDLVVFTDSWSIDTSGYGYSFDETDAIITIRCTP